MWMERMLGVSKAANGYVVECHAPIKPEKEDDEKEVSMAYPGSCEKQYIAKDMNEVFTLIRKLMPLLDEPYKSEDEFDKAFNKVAKMKTKEEY